MPKSSIVKEEFAKSDLVLVPDGIWVRAEERVLWYSAQYRDWDLSNGTAPREVGTLGLFQWHFAF